MSDKKKETIFRAASLERLSSPEQLDKLVKVTNSKGWLSLIGILFILTVTLIWSFVGEVPTKVNARGILIKSGGIKSIEHSTSGKITDVSIIQGMTVEKGDVIARLASPDTLARISSAKFELENLEQNKQRYLDFFIENGPLKKDYFVRSQGSKEEQLRDAMREVDDQKKKLEAQKDLFKRGGVSGEDLRNSQQELDRLELVRDNAQNALKQLTMSALSENKQHGETLTGLTNRVSEKMKEITFLQQQLDMQSKVVTPYSGKVIEVLTQKGGLIAPGQPVATIELSGKDLKNIEGIVFISSIEGKKLDPGMDAQISPSTVKAAEYGVMLGKVTSVSEYPVTRAYMAKILGPDLAQQFAVIGDPMEIKVDLVSDPDTISGFKWSSRNGPPIQIRTGTPADITVTIKKERPIALVFPIFKSKLGL